MLEALDRLIATLGGAVDLQLLSPVARPLVERLVAGPQARESLLALRRLVAAAPLRSWPREGKAVDALAAVLSSGTELPRLLARRPARLELLSDPALGRPWSKQELAHDLADALAAREQAGGTLEGDALAEALATFRNDHYVRLAACEFGTTPLEQVGRELAHLADVCLQAALDRVIAQLGRRHGPPLRHDGGSAPRPCGLAALAMGKYGGEELNFCSDIDLVFVYATDEGAAGERSLHEFFSAVVRRVIHALSSHTPEGIAFRVDLRLRPEGDRGPLCNALASAEHYYEAWGGPYDRLAWLKARPAAGDFAVAEEMLRILRPFVYPRSTRPDVIEQLHELSRRIRDELRGQALVPGWNVKLGAGGIRDVEFFVQALQLLHGGKQPVLQQRTTLRALERLLFAGLISEQERHALAEAYDLFRRIEHRLQLRGGQQTHHLPNAGPVREHVVAHLGHDAAGFDALLRGHRDRVRAIYATLGCPPAADEVLLQLSAGQLSAEQTTQALAAAGFAQPERAAAALAELREKAWGPFGRAPSPVARRVAGPLLAEISASPDPDAALGHVVALSLRYGAFDGLWQLFDENRDALRLLCNLFGTSDYLARMLVAHPELIDQLLLAGEGRAPRDAAQLAAALQRRLHELPDDDLGERLATLRRFRNEQVLRIALADVAGELEQDAVWQQLTATADAILAALYPLLLAEVTRRYGEPRHGDGSPAAMAVFGLGKLGSGEMSYGSDLDLIFIYSGEGHTAGGERQGPISNGELFARLAQRLVNALAADLSEGRLYPVDTRLRPSGSQGMLVASRGGFIEHHERAPETWQRQTLLKARAVAGDADLGAAVQRWIEDHLFDAASPADRLASDVAAMRRRIETELAREEGGFYNFKLGRGGLVDVEFVAQYLQLRDGHARQALRARSTLAVLDAAREAGLLDGAVAAVLLDGYRFLRRLEGRLRLVRDRSAERLPATPAELELIARRLGYRAQGALSAGAQLLRDYRHHTDAVRHAYDGILENDAQPA